MPSQKLCLADLCHPSLTSLDFRAVLWTNLHEDSGNSQRVPMLVPPRLRCAKLMRLRLERVDFTGRIRAQRAVLSGSDPAFQGYEDCDHNRVDDVYGQ